MGRNYARKDTPTAADLSLIWDSANSDWRLSPLSAVSTLVEGSLTLLQTAVQKPVSQYLTPADGFSVTLEGTDDLHLILTPAGTISTGTILLPISPGTADKQTVLVTSSQQITGLTVNGNGALLVGEPITILAGGFFTMKYDMSTNTWYRVG